MKKLRIMVDISPDSLAIWTSIGDSIEHMGNHGIAYLTKLRSSIDYDFKKTVKEDGYVSFKKTWKIISPFLRRGDSIYFIYLISKARPYIHNRTVDIQPGYVSEDMENFNLKLMTMRELMALVIKYRFK